MTSKPISSEFESFDLVLLKNVIKQKYIGRVPLCFLHSYYIFEHLYLSLLICNHWLIRI